MCDNKEINDTNIKECIYKDEFNETSSFGAKCIITQTCIKILQQLLKENPKFDYSTGELHNVECVPSSFAPIQKTYCENNEDCKLWFCGEECKTGYQRFIHVRCNNNICEGLKYFARNQIY